MRVLVSVGGDRQVVTLPRVDHYAAKHLLGNMFPGSSTVILKFLD